MRRGSWSLVRGFWFLAAGCWLAMSSPPAAAQDTAATENVEVEPIACYWRTSTDAVRVGEPFTLVLTCGVLDTAATTVIPDQSRLDPGVLQLQPFEVRGGEQAPDLSTATRRYFQYEYQLRYVGEETGRDLTLPPLTLTYRVQSRVQQDSAAVEGRERQYVLPAHAIRILSTVPGNARDIRDASPVTLAEIDARRFRASALRVVSWMLYAVGALVAVWAAIAIARRRRTKTAVVARHVSDAAVLSRAMAELADVRRARAAGWTDALAARALAALRVAASYEAGLPVAQIPTARAGGTLLSGQLRVPAGLLRGGAVIVSGSATSEVLARMAQDSGLSARRRARLSDLQDALNRLSESAYGRGDAVGDRLDEALEAGERAARAVRNEHSWLATQARAFRQWAGDSVRTRGWARS